MRKPCATPCWRARLNVTMVFWPVRGKTRKSVKSVETFDEKVGLAYSALTENERLNGAALMGYLMGLVVQYFFSRIELPADRNQNLRLLPETRI